MMIKTNRAVLLESKIRQHRHLHPVVRWIVGGRFRLAYLQQMYYWQVGTMFDDKLLNLQKMSDINRDRALDDEILQHPYEFRKTEISDLPRTYLVEVCEDLKKAINTSRNPERLTFLLQRFQYELLSRK